MIEEVAPGVFAYAHEFVEGKNGVVIGARTGLAIDCGNFDADGEAMAAFLRAQGRTPDRLALTHGHGDHLLGGAAFREAEIYAHALTPGVIRRQLDGWARRWETTPEDAAARVIWPTVTFTEELRLDVGGKTVRMFPTPGHSEDGVGVLVEEHGILFAGDSVATGIAPAIGDGDSRVMEATLGRLAEMEFAVLVPGHGPLLRGAEAIREWLLWVQSYLAGVRQCVRAALDAGADAETAIDAAAFDAFIGERLPRDRHGMPRRHRLAVEKIVSEEIAAIAAREESR